MKKLLLFLILISATILTACSQGGDTKINKPANSNPETSTPKNTIVEEFYLNTDINKNTLYIKDSKSNLNGTTITYSKKESIDESDKFNIQILPCEKMPLDIPADKEVISDCFKIENGTTEDVLVIFPNDIFKNYQKEIKDRNIYLWHFVDSRFAEDVPDPGMWAGSSLSYNSGMILESTSYLGGYYFIGKK